MRESLFSLIAPEANGDDSVTAETLFAGLLRQLAVARALIDEADRVARAVGRARATDAEGLSDQVVEEMARLGRRLVEAAELIVRSRPHEDSGVFSRYPSSGSAW